MLSSEISWPDLIQRIRKMFDIEDNRTSLEISFETTILDISYDPSQVLMRKLLPEEHWYDIKISYHGSHIYCSQFWLKEKHFFGYTGDKFFVMWDKYVYFPLNAFRKTLFLPILLHELGHTENNNENADLITNERAATAWAFWYLRHLQDLWFFSHAPKQLNMIREFFRLALMSHIISEWQTNSITQ